MNGVIFNLNLWYHDVIGYVIFMSIFIMIICISLNYAIDQIDTERQINSFMTIGCALIIFITLDKEFHSSPYFDNDQIIEFASGKHIINLNNKALKLISPIIAILVVSCGKKNG